LRKLTASLIEPNNDLVPGGSLDGEKPVDIDTEDADVAMGEYG